jgi:hypothetical protein
MKILTTEPVPKTYEAVFFQVYGNLKNGTVDGPPSWTKRALKTRQAVTRDVKKQGVFDKKREGWAFGAMLGKQLGVYQVGVKTPEPLIAKYTADKIKEIIGNKQTLIVAPEPVPQADLYVSLLHQFRILPDNAHLWNPTPWQKRPHYSAHADELDLFDSDPDELFWPFLPVVEYL